jgi:hypothetical protein
MAIQYPSWTRVPENLASSCKRRDVRARNTANGLDQLAPRGFKSGARNHLDLEFPWTVTEVAAVS